VDRTTNKGKTMNISKNTIKKAARKGLRLSHVTLEGVSCLMISATCATDDSHVMYKSSNKSGLFFVRAKGVSSEDWPHWIESEETLVLQFNPMAMVLKGHENTRAKAHKSYRQPRAGDVTYELFYKTNDGLHMAWDDAKSEISAKQCVNFRELDRYQDEACLIVTCHVTNTVSAHFRKPNKKEAQFWNWSKPMVGAIGLYSAISWVNTNGGTESQIQTLTDHEEE
jgi:hypothetical protein